MTKPIKPTTHQAFLLSEAALKDLLKQDRSTFAPETGEVYREVGGNWHVVELDYPDIRYAGRVDTRLHVTEAVLTLLPGEDIAQFLTDLRGQFTAAFLIDETRSSLFFDVELESNSMAALGRQIHLGNLVVHYKQASHGIRRKV